MGHRRLEDMAGSLAVARGGVNFKAREKRATAEVGEGFAFSITR